MSPTRVAMVVCSHYPYDVRVRREAQALRDAGMRVDVICLRDEGESPREEVNGVRAFRIDLKRKRAGKGRYLWEYGFFFLSAFLLLVRLHRKNPYRVVHVHTMPDILVFCALVPKLSGAKVILDLHDLMPELYRSLYSLPEDHPTVRLLRFLERRSIAFCDLALTPNLAFRERFLLRGCPPGKMHIVMNSPDERVFREEAGAKPPRKPDGRFVFMFHGQVFERQGLDTALDALPLVREKIPGLLFRVYGDGNYLTQVKDKARALDLGDVVSFHGKVPLETIVDALRSADAGVVPNRRTPFTELNLPTRILECLSLGKPVIAPRTRGVLDYFDEASLFFFEPDNEQDLARAMLGVYGNPSRRRRVVEKGRKVYEEHRWERERAVLLNLVKGLVS